MHPAINVTLRDGYLRACFEKTRHNYYTRISSDAHAKVYEGVFDNRYAEPEFTGKYLDICAYYYETEKDARALENGKKVLSSILKNQREDGYLGCLVPGNETQAFSIWNHCFTIYGLTRLYEAAGLKDALFAAERAAKWLMDAFMPEGSPDILDAGNGGSQHITSIFSMMRLYKATGKKEYALYVKWVLDHCEKTDMNLLSFDNILSLRSRKGIEMLVVYLGVLLYGQMMGDGRAIAAAKRYWQQIVDTQMRNTGNGTVREVWTENGNRAQLLATEKKSNETCVAVGWIELSLALFHVCQEAKYLDAVEKTLFNHMMGSFDKSGEDFAYYQGNFGKKIYRTAEAVYQCCRYRGFTIFSYMKEYLYHFNGATLIPMVYCPSSFVSPSISLLQETNYPKNGRVRFSADCKQDGLRLRLRIPIWCKKWSLSMNGKSISLQEKDGYVDVCLEKGQTELALELQMEVSSREDLIEEKPYASFQYGPLLLAMDTHYGNELWQEAIRPYSLAQQDAGQDSIVHFTLNDLHLVDFASAGGIDPKNDSYTVFVPVCDQ